MKIVGIGGLPRSGKDTVAELFIQSGYFGISFGDVVRGFALERHKDKPDPISVANMTETSNWLRETRGPDVILQAALKEFEEAQAKGGNHRGLVLFSIRAPIEADWILAHDGELIWVEASAEVRHRRNTAHLRSGEAEISLEEFIRQEDLQSKPQPGIPEEIQMNTSYVKDKATHTLVNNEGDIEDFLREAQQLIQEIS